MATWRGGRAGEIIIILVYTQNGILLFFEPKRRAEESDRQREAERRELDHGHRSEEPDVA